MPRLSDTKLAALRAISAAGADGAIVNGKRPLTSQTIDPLEAAGLVRTFTKTVVGVQIRKAALTDAGREALL